MNKVPFWQNMIPIKFSFSFNTDVVFDPAGHLIARWGGNLNYFYI